jgi:hypothetical protein
MFQGAGGKIVELNGGGEASRILCGVEPPISLLCAPCAC